MRFTPITIVASDVPLFWAKVRKYDECWEWDGLLGENRYGRFVPRGGQFFAAHRYSWTLANGPIPAGKVVCHSCDNRKCVNPAHLFVGSQSDNLRDASRKGRLPMAQRTHCNHGHPLSGDNLVPRADHPGRACLTCRRRYRQAAKKRKRLAKGDTVRAYHRRSTPDRRTT